jgi:hypothetical protein
LHTVDEFLKFDNFSSLPELLTILRLRITLEVTVAGSRKPDEGYDLFKYCSKHSCHIDNTSEGHHLLIHEK